MQTFGSKEIKPFEWIPALTINAEESFTGATEELTTR